MSAADKPIRASGTRIDPLPCFAARDLAAFARSLFAKAGMPDERARVVADVLVEGELLGRETHGLALLAPYLAEIEAGGIAVEGWPSVVSDFAACLTWDGRKLPGPWLVTTAFDEAMSRASRFGLGAVAIRRSHHTAALGAYLRRVAERGFLGLLTLTDPGFSSVAPFGGTKGVLTSNPIAFGAPTDREPIIVDISTSMVTNAMVVQAKNSRQTFPGPWLLDAEGTPSDDPNVMASDPPGTILPLGGLDAGHKGYGIGMMVEFLSGCLSGHGRAEPKDGWSASVLVLAIAPQAFGPRDAYDRQVKALTDTCLGSPARAGFDRVRLPGEAGAIRRAYRLRHGIPIPPDMRAAWESWAAKFREAIPTPL
jgi:LDH2 family malate/lactate/ureidoglycolate dehydrogenase